MRVRTLELARTGVWGQDGAAISRKDLAEVKANFAGRPPLTLGHIPQGQSEGPRYGRVLGVDLAEGGNLLIGKVEFGDIADEAFAKGLYDGWSVGIPRRAKDGTRYLHHLALLGETPPKIPGLKETETASYAYADGDVSETYSFGGAIKERREELDVAEIDELKEKLEKLEGKVEGLEGDVEELEKGKEAAGGEASDTSVKVEAEVKVETAPPDTEFADRMAKMESELRKSRAEAFMAKVSGKIPEGLRDKARGLAGRLAGDAEPFNFSDGGKTAGATALGLLGDILARWPEPVKTGTSGIDFADPETGKAPDWGKVAAGI